MIRSQRARMYAQYSLRKCTGARPQDVFARELNHPCALSIDTFAYEILAYETAMLIALPCIVLDIYQ